MAKLPLSRKRALPFTGPMPVREHKGVALSQVKVKELTLTEAQPAEGR